MTTAEIKTTFLHEWHVAHGANMALFGGYDMPLWYPQGAKSEHLAVIRAAGLFDTSHMAALLVEGSGARSLIQHCFSKDIDHCIGAQKKPLSDGRSVYGLFLNESAHVIDDAIVSQAADQCFMVVVNAGMGPQIKDHLQNESGKLEVSITDLTDKLGKIDIQGKDSAKIIAKLLKQSDEVLTSMPYFSFKGWFDEMRVMGKPVIIADDISVMLSRTGYTGEFGFEIFVAPQKVQTVWESLLAAGEEYGIQPCGLASRDSLRAGAVLPLSHQDIGAWPFANNPWQFAVAEKKESGQFTKEYIGAKALNDLGYNEYTFAFAGYDPRKLSLSDSARVLDSEGTEIGVILTCATDMAIGRDGDRIVSIGSPAEEASGFSPRGLCCGFIRVTQSLKVGEKVMLSDGKRKLEVEIRSDVRPDRTARRPLSEML